ncbi:hypothetical protein Tco_0703617 [Tanacetum coccineum]|uniref:Retrotransposon gag domain-containing protein n=1 Tax=Tanacetum coccineum TaxID=301880 RepID=A0ABQ4Y081_9ASTR
MSTRSSAIRLLSPIEDPERLLSRRNQSEPSLLFDLEEDDMAGQAPPQGSIPDLRSMEEMLQALTDGVGDAIVVTLILANPFELDIGLLNLVTAIAFHGFENDDPHSHIRRFTKITQTVKLNNVSTDVFKLLWFPFSLEEAARTWLEKEPPNSITTWNDLVSKFGETFAEACDRFKDLLNKCPHHGFSPLHQIDTFYNNLNQSEQDSLNSAANGNFLTKNTQEALTIIENKSKVQTSRNKPQVASASGSSNQDAHITSLTKKVEALFSLHRPVNSIQNGCETYSGPHAYYECQAAEMMYQHMRTTEARMQQMQDYNNQQLQYLKTQNTNMSNQMGQMQKSGVTLVRPSAPPPPLSSSKEVEPELETITDQVLTESTTRVPPPVVLPSSASTSSELPPAPVSYLVIPELNPHQPLIPYPSRLNKEKLQDKADIQIHNLLTNKEKLLELANTPLNENCLAVLLKKLPEKL